MRIAGSASTFAARSRAHRAIRLALLACLTVLHACHTWRPTELAPRPDSAATQRVRVVRTDGNRMVVDAARVVGDTLTGRRPETSLRVAIPVAGIRRVERRELDSRRTTLLVFGVVVALYLAVGAYAASQMEFGFPPG